MDSTSSSGLGGGEWHLFQKGSGSTTMHTLAMSGLIFIGCEECDILLQSPGVEKRHAVISYDTLKQEFWIKDLNSVTGTYINGVRIPEQSYFKLSHEDSIRFGYGPIFLLKRPSSETDTCKTEEESTYLADSLEDVRESDLGTTTSSLGAPQEPPILEEEGGVRNNNNTSGASSIASCSSPIGELEEDCPLTPDTTTPPTLPPPPNMFQKSSRNEAIVAPFRQSEQMVDDSPPEYEKTLPLPTPPPPAPTPMAFTIPFDSDSSSSSRTFTRRKPPTRSHHYNTAIVNPSSKMESTPPPPIRHDSIEEAKTPLTDAASYLIQRMLIDNPSSRHNEDVLDLTKVGGGGVGGGQRPWELQSNRTWIRNRHGNGSSTSTTNTTTSPHSSSPEHKQSPPGGHDNDDNKSETGTYTVETELNDPQVAEARNKIDEVFGLQQKQNAAAKTNAETQFKTLKQPSEIPMDKKSSLLGHHRSSSTGSSLVPKLYSPASKMVPPLLSDAKYSHLMKSHQELDISPPQRPPRSSARSNSGNSARSVENVFAPNRSAVNHHPNQSAIRRAGSVGGSRDAWSDGSSPPHSRTSHRTNSLGGDRENFGCFWRRKSWNLSCSDLDNDQNNKSETGSVVSDISTSTEPSSHSSHSYGGRHQRSSVEGVSAHHNNPAAQAPQMRLNRAFALRRARLGFESDDAIATSSPAHSNRAPVSPRLERHQIQQQRPLTATAVKPQSTLSKSNLSRQDGGRFSLRLPRNAATRVGRNIQSPGGDATTANRTSPAPQRINSNWNAQQKGFVYPNRRDHVTTSDAQPVATPTYDKERRTSFSSNKKEVSALDGLVITAIHQLSNKLRVNSCDLLTRERSHYPDCSEGRLLIDEVLPSGGSSSNSRAKEGEANLTRDLSAILKNLKKVEQTLEVLSTLGETCPTGRVRDERYTAQISRSEKRPTASNDRHKDPRSFFIVDV